MLEHKTHQIEHIVESNTKLLYKLLDDFLFMSRKLDLIIHQNRKIMADETKVLADIQAFGDALTSISDDQTVIAKEIADLSSGGGLTPETQAKLDDLATRSTAVASAIHSLVPVVPTPTTPTV